MAAVSGLVLASTILAGCAEQSSLTIALSDDRVGVGDEVVVRGALTESSPGVPISVESREAGTDDAFVAVGASTATDESGSYVLRFQLSKTGTFEIQTVAAPPEGDEVASQASELTVLTPTAVRITQGPEREIDAAEIVVIKGIVRPAKERRTVVLQESTGGVGWRETGVKDKTDSQGRFRLTVKPRSTGALTWRVFVQESASGAEGASAIVRTQVVDYKTAGAQYLKCIESYNAAYRQMDALRYGDTLIDTPQNKVVGANAADQAEWAVGCFQDFSWPPSIEDDIADLTDIVARDAQYFRDFANPSGEAGMFTAYSDWVQAQGVGPLADGIRATLGLPPRG
jgi:hypothetical protein